MKVNAIVTTPPYAVFLNDIARHPMVCGFRLNTVMPLHEGPKDALQRLQSFGKPIWVDLKGRQLRVVGAAIPPYTEVIVSHRIRVKTPVNAFFSDGRECVRVMAVDGNRLILEDGPRRLVGPGESVNIVHPSLEIEGTLTETDLAYLEAMRELGLKQVMLSFVESPSDIEEVQRYLPEAEVMAKIESRRGLEFVRKHRNEFGQLMAARGDLFVEVLRPHHIIGALGEIIKADSDAVAASRLFGSLAYESVPNSADIGDVAYLLSIGYKTFMLGDAVCLNREPLLEALNLLEAIVGEFQ
jgi:pyruvate kinase